MGPTRAAHEGGAAVRGTPHIYTCSSSTHAAQNAAHVCRAPAKTGINATAGMSGSLHRTVAHHHCATENSTHTKNAMLDSVSPVGCNPLLLGTKTQLGQRPRTHTCDRDGLQHPLTSSTQQSLVVMLQSAHAAPQLSVHRHTQPRPQPLSTG